MIGLGLSLVIMIGLSIWLQPNWGKLEGDRWRWCHWQRRLIWCIAATSLAVLVLESLGTEAQGTGRGKAQANSHGLGLGLVIMMGLNPWLLAKVLVLSLDCFQAPGKGAGAAAGNDTGKGCGWKGHCTGEHWHLHWHLHWTSLGKESVH